MYVLFMHPAPGEQIKHILQSNIQLTVTSQQSKPCGVKASVWLTGTVPAVDVLASAEASPWTPS